MYGPQTITALSRNILDSLDSLGDLQTYKKKYYFPIGKESGLDDSEFEKYSQLFGICVGHQDNKNLSGPQKDLFLWRCNMGFSMYRIHDLMHEKNMEDLTVFTTVLPPVINPK